MSSDSLKSYILKYYKIIAEFLKKKFKNFSKVLVFKIIILGHTVKLQKNVQDLFRWQTTL